MLCRVALSVVDGVVEARAYDSHVSGDRGGKPVYAGNGAETDARRDEGVLDHVLTRLIQDKPGERPYAIGL